MSNLYPSLRLEKVNSTRVGVEMTYHSGPKVLTCLAKLARTRGTIHEVSMDPSIRS